MSKAFCLLVSLGYLKTNEEYIIFMGKFMSVVLALFRRLSISFS